VIVVAELQSLSSHRRIHNLQLPDYASYLVDSNFIVRLNEKPAISSMNALSGEAETRWATLWH